MADFLIITALPEVEQFACDFLGPWYQSHT
jgi:hypothetical protein